MSSGRRGRNGLNPAEFTIAERLKEHGYATLCIGKWHLGDQPEFLPTRQGFDHYFGIPYSNDMQRRSTETGENVVPLLRDDKVAELLTDEQQSRIVERYTDEAVGFIRANKDRPFFLYLPHTAVHTPICPGEAFRGKSDNGRFGDWVEEVDWSVGRVLDTLRELKLDEQHAGHLHQRQRPVADQGRRRRQRRAVARRQGQHLGRRRARADDRLVAGQDRAGQRLRRRRGHHRSAADLRDAGRRQGAGRAGDRRARHLAAAVRQDARNRRVKRTTTSPATTCRPCGRDRGSWPSPRNRRRWAEELPRMRRRTRDSTTSTRRSASRRTWPHKHPEIVAELQALAEKMDAEIGGKSPLARRPAGVVENPQTLYPTEAKKPRAKQAAKQRAKAAVRRQTR